MFIVKSKFFETYNKGTQHERRACENYWRDNGPFESRDMAEKFAVGLAHQNDIAAVRIDATGKGDGER